MITKLMAAATLLFVAVLKLAAAQQLRINTRIIQTDGTESRPSQKEQRNAHLNIRNDIRTTLVNFSLIPECGDGLWK